jgi:hypothetical protein
MNIQLGTFDQGHSGKFITAAGTGQPREHEAAVCKIIEETSDVRLGRPEDPCQPGAKKKYVKY